MRRKKKGDDPAPDADGKVPPKEEKKSGGFMRISKDLEEMEIAPNVQLLGKDLPDYPMKFSLEVTATEGLWNGGKFEFEFEIPKNYPIDAPLVRLAPRDKIYHPNIDSDGKICVSALRPWKPIYTAEYVMFGLLFLFTSPNSEGPVCSLNLLSVSITLVSVLCCARSSWSVFLGED